MEQGDTASATSDPSIASQVQSAFAALRAETDAAPVGEAEATTEVTTAGPEVTESDTETEAEVPVEKVRFKIGDEEVDEDTLLEWKKSGLRQDAFTRKTQEIAAQKKQVESERAAERAQVLAKLQHLESIADSLLPKEPNWADLRAQVQQGRLAQSDLDGFAARWLEDKQARDALAVERQKAEEAVQRDKASEAEATAKKNYERVLEIIPEWSDVPTRQKDFQEIVAYAAELGVDENVLMSLPPEGFKMARDATAYHKLSKAKPKIVKVDAATLKPGSTAGQVPKSSGVDTATRRLAQTHTDADGVAAFRELRKAGAY